MNAYDSGQSALNEWKGTLGLNFFHGLQEAQSVSRALSPVSLTCDLLDVRSVESVLVGNNNPWRSARFYRIVE